MLLKMTEDPKGRLFVGVISIVFIILKIDAFSHLKQNINYFPFNDRAILF